jgi:peptidoglycan/xylan/chitin deacetylase (PgdA/CDA1 family)
MTWRKFAKSVAHGSGILGAFHRIRHGECLTVLMFHRVLPRSMMSRSEADPVYTVAQELLAEMINFLKQNYALVSIRDVLASLAREKPLPRNSLLITFDDGWRDNLQWGLPTLGSVPWIVFIASDAILASGYWWQEVLLWTWRSKRASYEELWESATPLGCSEQGREGNNPLALLLRYGGLSPERRCEILAPYEGELRARGEPRHMLTQSDVAKLRDDGIAIGSHGASHLPLSFIADPSSDLGRAKNYLRDFGATPAMSFPHGRYNARALSAARQLGYSALFTSDPVLNFCPDGWLRSDRIGRIPVSTASITRRSGSLKEQELATQLFLRDVYFGAEVTA